MRDRMHHLIEVLSPSVWQTFHGLLLPIGAGTFAAYLAIVALLITLAVARHDELMPLSETIAGHWHKMLAGWELGTFVLAMFADVFPPHWLTISALASSSIALSWIAVLLFRSIQAAVAPRIFNRAALQMVKHRIRQRVMLAYRLSQHPKSSLSIRGTLTSDLLLKQNKTLRIVRSTRSGLVSFRAKWEKRLSRHLEGVKHAARARVAHDAGDYVRIGDELRIVPSRSPWIQLLAWRMVRVIPFDRDYWEDVRLAAVTAFFSNDRTTYHRGTELFITGFKVLGELKPTYQDMWPAIGCSELSDLAIQFANLIHDLADPPSELGLRFRGGLLLQVVQVAVEDPRTVHAIQFVLERLKGNPATLSPDDLGYLFLRQGFFPIPAVIPVWAAFVAHWIGKDSSIITDVAEWCEQSGITPQNLGEPGSLLGAIWIIYGKGARSTFLDSLVNNGSKALAAEIQQHIALSDQ